MPPPCALDVFSAQHEPTYGTFKGEAEDVSAGVGNECSCSPAQSPHPSLDGLGFKQGLACCLGAVTLFAQVPSAVRMLYNIDAQTFTPCNILCGGNLVGIFFLPMFYRSELTARRLERVTRHEILMTLLSAFLYSALGPALQLTGIGRVSVTSLAMLQRLESVNLIVLSSIIERALPSRWSILNSLSIVAIVMTFLASAFVEGIDMFGCLLIVASGWCFSGSLMVTRSQLSNLSPGQVSSARVVFGFFFYHLLNIVMGMEDGLSRLYSVFYWQYMVVYGFLYVVCGAVLWTLALRNCSAATLAVGITTLFPLQLVFAYLVLGECPDSSHAVLAGFLIVVIGSGALEVLWKEGSFNAQRCTCYDTPAQADIVPLKGI